MLNLVLTKRVCQSIDLLTFVVTKCVIDTHILLFFYFIDVYYVQLLKLLCCLTLTSSVFVCSLHRFVVVHGDYHYDIKLSLEMRKI